MKMNEFIEKINKISKEIGRSVTIMEVCGGHTNTVMKYGIREILPKNVRLISGPGCPVCVTSQKDIDNMIAIARSGELVATYGDMVHVPGTNGSLSDWQAKGEADVKIIVSASEMLKEENKGRVFFAVGFETTTPMTAYLLKKGVCIYPCHKIMPPPMKALVNQNRIDGFIDPGHVSAIIGTSFWKELNVPQVICGFNKDQIIRGVYKLLELIKDGKNCVINDYPEVVKEEGNLKAQKIISETMKVCDCEWRGIGVIEGSGMEPIDESLNAKIKYANLINSVDSKENSKCICGDILRGEKEPFECELFGKVCTPKNPIGACMVSETEGACGIAYKYNKGL